MAKKSGKALGAVSAAAKVLGAKGCHEGGRKRAEVLTPERRSEIASQGAKAANATKKGRGKS